MRRPGLDRLRDLTALAKLDRILITDPDRLARNYVHQVLLLEELQRHGCQVEFVDRPLSDDPQDQLLLQIRGAVAEYERTLIAERTRRGRLHKLQSGRMLPWTRPPYGYRVDPDRPRDPAGVRTDPTEAALVADLFRWYADEGRSFMAVVERLHDLGVRSPGGQEYWGMATVRGVLSNPTYTGTIYANRTRLRPARIRRSATHPIGRPRDSQVPLPPEQWIAVATIPAIVTRELFDRVQAKIAHNRSFATPEQHDDEIPSAGTGQLWHVPIGVSSSPNYANGKDLLHLHGEEPSGATAARLHMSIEFIPAAVLDDLVWADLVDLLLHPDRVAKALHRAAGGCGLPQELRARQENLRRGRLSLAQQIERLTEAYLSGVVKLDEYERRRKEFERRDGTLAKQQDELSGEASRAFELSGSIHSAESFAKRVRSGLDTATFEWKRQLVELLIDRVVVSGDNVEIRYAFPIGPAGEAGRFCHLRVDYLGDPNLIRTLDFQVFHEVRVARERMLAIGGPRLANRRSTAQAEFIHPAPNPFGVHRPAKSSHHLGEAPVAIGRPLGGQVEQSGLEHGLVDGRPRRVVDGAARHAEQPADETDRVGVGKFHDDLPFLVAGPPSSRDAFFRISSS